MPSPQSRRREQRVAVADSSPDVPVLETGDEGATEHLSSSVGPPGRMPAAKESDRAVTGVNSSSNAASNRMARQLEAERDLLLIEQARHGDKQAFKTLVERHQRRAFAIAIALVRDENDAREVVQEAFLRVYRGLDAFNGSSSFFTWLYRIVTNLAIDLIRKPSRREGDYDDSRLVDAEEDIPLLSRIDGADPADVMRRRELADRIRAALGELPPYHRDVIVMREVEGMSYEEMATAMQVSKGTIMSRLFHARQKLQRALHDCYTDQFGERAKREEGEP